MADAGFGNLDVDRFAINAPGPLKLDELPTMLVEAGNQDGYSNGSARQFVEDQTDDLAAIQRRLYANQSRGALILLHGADAAGKDGLIRHVFSGINPVGLVVTGYHGPSTGAQRRGLLWDAAHVIPLPGTIGIMNRSFYETIMYERAIDDGSMDDKEWDSRTRTILDFESYLARNGITVVKIFLHISKAEQGNRLRSRLNDPQKRWKLTDDDLESHLNWSAHINAFERVIGDTAHEEAPWYVVPGDSKWVARAIVAQLIKQRLDPLALGFPTKARVDLKAAKRILE